MMDCHGDFAADSHDGFDSDDSQGHFAGDSHRHFHCGDLGCDSAAIPSVTHMMILAGIAWMLSIVFSESADLSASR